MKLAHAPCSNWRVQTFVYFFQRRKSYEFCARNTLIPRQIDRTKMHYRCPSFSNRTISHHSWDLV
jgi:hypothetical protein